MFKKIIQGLGITLLFISLWGCQQKPEPENIIKVGTIAGPETTLMEVAKQYAKECYGLTIKIVTFSDYNMPNAALADKSIDANMFQHVPYLEAQNKGRGYNLIPAGKTFVYPMGLYAKRIKSVAELKAGDKVAIPNDPSNQARALLLLQQAKLIKLKPGATILSTANDIASNPKKLKIVTLDAAQLPRALDDVAIAVINTNFAIPAGLTPVKALFVEDSSSPYVNVVAVRAEDKDNLKTQELVSSLHSPEVLKAAKRLFGDGAIPAWKLSEPRLPCLKQSTRVTN